MKKVRALLALLAFPFLLLADENDFDWSLDGGLQMNFPDIVIPESAKKNLSPEAISTLNKLQGIDSLEDLPGLKALPDLVPPAQERPTPLLPIVPGANPTVPPPPPPPTDPNQHPLSLEALEAALSSQRHMEDRHRLSLLSLVQMHLGRPDDAYVTLKGISGDTSDAYHLQELQLANRLGLDDEVKRLGRRLSDRFFPRELQVTKVVLCSSVKGFGRYEPIPDGGLKSGQMAIVYIEMRDQKLQSRGPRFHSSCRVQFELHQGPHRVQHYVEPKAFDDSVLSDRRDSFVWIKWRASIPRGSYRMTVIVDDAYSGKQARAEQDIMVF